MEETRKELLERTRQMWQPHAHKPLSDEDVRQILENTVGFFRVLGEWVEKKDDRT
jgi:hypothetical protein